MCSAPGSVQVIDCDEAEGAGARVRGYYADRHSCGTEHRSPFDAILSVYTSVSLISTEPIKAALGQPEGSRGSGLEVFIGEDPESTDNGVIIARSNPLYDPTKKLCLLDSL